MRLLSKDKQREAVEDFRSSLVEERNRLSTEIAELVKKKNLEELSYANLSREMEEKKTALRKSFELLNSELISETKALEARKEEAVRPLYLRERAIITREEAALRNLETLKGMAISVGEERAALAQVKIRNADMSSMLDERERSISVRESSLQEAEDLNKKSTLSLSESWQKFKDAVQIQEEKLNEREQELFLRYGEMEAERKWQVEQRGILSKEKRALQSERDAISSAFNQARKKGIIQ